MNKNLSGNTRLAKNTLMLYIRMLFIMGVNLFSVRFVLDVLGAVDYGLYNVVAGIVTMFAFLSGTMTSATQRYISFELPKNNKDRLKEIFNLSLLSYLGISVVVLLIAETIGLWFLNTQMVIPVERINAVHWVYQASVLSFVISLMGTTFLSEIIAHERMGIFALASMGDNFLKLAIIFIIPYLKGDALINYAFLITIITLIVQLFYFIYNRINFNECKFSKTKNWFLLKEMTHFASWNMMGTLSNMFKLQGVNILLNIFFNPVINAARAIAFQVNNAIVQLAFNFYKAIGPQIVKSYAIKDYKRLNSLSINGAKFGFYLMMIIAIPLLIEIDYILALWLKEVPSYTVVFCRLMIVNSLFEAYNNPLVQAIQASGKIKWYQIIVSGVVLLNLPISYFLYNQGFPPETAMIVSIILAIISLIPRVYFAQKLADISCMEFLTKVLLKTIPIFILTWVVVNLLKNVLSQSFIRLCIVTVSSIIVSIILGYFIGLSTEEKKYVLSIVKNNRNQKDSN
nr:lipopolysaccharide biosynthesis protein [uncultured Carboxylicivirga sp.]